MLSEIEKSYLDKNPMKRLTFDGINDLYQHPLYGARTISNCIEMASLRPIKAAKTHHPIQIDVSDEMERRNEDCIEKYGCGMF